MNTNDYLKLLDELDDDDALNAFLQFDAQRSRYPKGRISQKLNAEEQAFIAAQDDTRAGFSFTYKASRHEASWLLDSLGAFYEGKWISDVLRQIKSGKEASVYLCKSGVAVDTPYLAAKVYRPRMLRNLKNDHLYRVGRTELDEDGIAIVKEADLNAIEKRTSYGEKLRHQSWIAYEYQTMHILKDAGVDVPTPHAMGNNAILMDYIGNTEMAAPTLQSLDLEFAEAQNLFNCAITNIDLMLAQERIHGDLSAYNILYWEGEITLIDFPQVVSPESNPAAWTIFLRDIVRTCEYFERQGIKSRPYELTAELWRSHGYKVRKKVDPRYLDPENVDDRRLWENQIGV